MARFFSILLFLSVAALALSGMLMSLTQGNLECNLARLKIISEVRETEDAVAQIDTTELNAAAAVGVAQAGLKSIDNAIQDILAAIFDNEPAPADSREQLADGAKAVKIGLDSITDASTSKVVAAALEKLFAVDAAGDDVVALCI
ncbi:hypothetical protein C8J57DRAFT_1644492 [Mycena rebaudengoi]|nr:hypothetical protein C8J57DRAFT_1644492 [Mycena rebaudengoi]